MALNPHAKILGCTYGKVDIEDVLGVMDGQGVADFGTIDDHKETISAFDASAAAAPPTTPTEPAAATTTSDHAHSHSSGEHGHGDEVRQEGDGKGSSSHSHSHSHAHGDHASEGQEFDPNCATCTEGEGHGHDHSHSHAHGASGEGTTTAAKRFGIDNFVYRQRRPFHPERLGHVLQHMPGSSNLALADAAMGSSKTDTTPNASTGAGGDAEMDDDLRAALGKLVRSKGFMWLAFSDDAAMYWSHAGASFEILCLGRWWDSLAPENWPPGQEEAITEDFEVGV
ncbi:unnamed protein product [Sphacelaria rigidula]